MSEGSFGSNPADFGRAGSLQERADFLIGWAKVKLSPDRVRKSSDIFKNLEQELRTLVELHGASAVWDTFIQSGAPPELLADVNQPEQIPAGSSEEVAQARHHFEVEMQERGESESRSRTFGLYEPGYAELLHKDIQRLSAKPVLRTLLLGSQSKHSANEFLKFSRELNSYAVASVVDLGRFGLRSADQALKRIQGDATELPIAPDSQDIIFSNFLIAQLKHDDKQASGRKIVAMLQEAYRALAPDGLLCLMEEPPFFHRTYGSSWLNYYLLRETLFVVGFKEVVGMYAFGYEDQRAKKKEDMDRLISDIGEYKIIINKETNKLVTHFSSAVKAKK